MENRFGSSGTERAAEKPRQQIEIEIGRESFARRQFS
jgi:hypothetical protein